MPPAPLRIALAQLVAAPCDVDENARRCAATISEAATRGAHLVAFPELFLTGYELPMLLETPGAWLRESDPRLEPIRRACAGSGVTAILGAPLVASAGARTIAAPVIGPDGDIGTSAKTHVHDSESAIFTAGEPLAPFEVQGWKVAVGICFDGAHPRHAERARHEGADLYVSSALYWQGEERRCDLHLGARAMDNRMFSALANYAGTTGGYHSCGLSGAWGPRGDMLARASGADEALIVTDLDPLELRPFRL